MIEPVISVVVVLVIATIAAWAVGRGQAEEDHAAWEEFLSSATTVERTLGGMARPFARTDAVQKAVQSSGYKWLERKLSIADVYNGSLEVFISLQIVAALIGAGGMVLAIGSGIDGLYQWALAGVSLVMPFWPYNYVSTRADKRAAAITSELPDFAELLIMVLPSTSVLNALNFTSRHTSGVVSAEIRGLVNSLSTRTIGQNECFDLTARRLGTPEGQEFVRVLQNAYMEGSKVVEMMSAQAENMRRVAYQRQRAMLKKLPVKLVIIFAVHFMPLLFAVAFLPVFVGLGRAL